MTVQFTQERKDVEQASRAVMGRKLLIVIAVGMFVVIAVQLPQILYFLWSGEGIQGIVRHDRVGLFLIAAVALLYALLYVGQPRLAARKLILRTVEYSFNDDGLRITTDVSASELRWNAFVRYKETQHQFLLYPQNNMAQFIPKRVLGPEQQAELRDLLQRHIPSK